MPKIDLLVRQNGSTDYSDEARKINEMLFKVGRTTTGNVSYTSLSSNTTSVALSNGKEVLK